MAVAERVRKSHVRNPLPDAVKGAQYIHQAAGERHHTDRGLPHLGCRRLHFEELRLGQQGAERVVERMLQTNGDLTGREQSSRPCEIFVHGSRAAIRCQRNGICQCSGKRVSRGLGDLNCTERPNLLAVVLADPDPVNDDSPGEPRCPRTAHILDIRGDQGGGSRQPPDRRGIDANELRTRQRGRKRFNAPGVRVLVAYRPHEIRCLHH